MSQRRCLSFLVTFGLLCCLPAAPVQAAGVETEEELLLLEQESRPAPVPAGRSYPPEVSASPEQRGIVVFDLGTRKEEVLPASSQSPLLELPADAASAGDAGMQWPAIREHGDGSPAEQLKITPTQPQPVYDIHSFPWYSIVKLKVQVEVDGTTYTYNCSAATAGEFHLVTAGHCVFFWDPNDDGDEGDARWADKVYAYAGQTDMVEPFGRADQPFGKATAVRLRSYQGWTQSQSFDHDWAVITLDRPIGKRVGWMGRETSTASSLNFCGYPTETPYVPENSLVQYHGYDQGNVVQYTSYRIHMDALVYGGHSGGPTWRYADSSGDRYITGINSTSDREGSAYMCLLTASKRADLNGWISSDEASLAPVARPELVEYLREPDKDFKELYANQVEPGGTVDVGFNYYNVGQAASGTVTIDFYLSTNSIISTGDIHIDSLTHSSLDANYYRQQRVTVDVPASVPSGVYYLGWLMSSSVPEYSDDEYGVIGDETLTVGSGCSVPGTPGGLSSSSSSGTVPSGSTYTLSWNTVSSADSYEIQESTNSSFTGAGTYSRTATSRDFSHTVSTDTTYYYRVRSRRSCGATSGWGWAVPVTVTAGVSGSNRYLVAGIAAAAGTGGSAWRSYLSVCNRSGARADLTLIYRHGSGTVTRTVQLPAGRIVGWNNVASNLFDVAGDSSGAVEVVSTREVTMQARTYNDTPDGTYGQLLPGVGQEAMISPGEQGLLAQLQKTAVFRTNIGFVNPGSAPCGVRIRLYDTNGNQVGSVLTATVPAGGWKQLNSVFSRAGVSQASVAYAIVEVTTSGGKIWAYASVVDGNSGDPTTIPMVNLG